MFVAVDGEARGLFAVADTIKEDSVTAVARLKALGIEVTMLTGDNQRTADAIARHVGVDRVLAEVLPEDKAAEVRKLQLEGKKVGMVGDGINDAPALTRADVGFAIGTGTDVAIEAADVTLISGSLQGVVTAIEISKATIRNVRQNLTGAFAYNSLGLPIALGALYPVLGVLLNPMLAAAAMAFSSVRVIANANRLKRCTPSRLGHDPLPDPRHRCRPGPDRRDRMVLLAQTTGHRHARRDDLIGLSGDDDPRQGRRLHARHHPRRPRDARAPHLPPRGSDPML